MSILFCAMTQQTCL